MTVYIYVYANLILIFVSAKRNFKLKQRREILRPPSKQNYGTWFKYHIEITGIPGFQFCYFHAGNDDTHTDGCPLVGNTLSNHWVVAKNPLASSIDGTRRVYELVYPHLLAGGKAYIEIRDEKVLF